MLAAFGVLAWRVGDEQVAQLAFLGFGAVIGFFCVNYPTGRLFLGDGGAYLLGFWVAEIAVLLLARNPSVNAWQVLSICAYPVIEVLYSMYRRKVVRKLSPGSPDCLHLHTLIFRRVVPRFFNNAVPAWKRNAAVAIVISPWVAVAAFLSVAKGTTFVAAGATVFAQLIVYLVVYARLVRGHWGRRWGKKTRLAAPMIAENASRTSTAESGALRQNQAASVAQARDEEFVGQQQLSEQI
jgi:hypothetical protein